MKLKIGHLYPDLLNLYGDRGNIQCMKKRCEWRGIEAEVQEFELDDPVDFSTLDIVLLGGGSDREQMLVCEKLRDKKELSGLRGEWRKCDRSVRRLPAARPLLRYG